MARPEKQVTGRPGVRTVSCPTCKGPSPYGPDNRFRPFCSERCQQMDLGAWASETFRVPEAESAQATPADLH
ncbi:MAG: DNA gyrase inhibitor YacG [Burkholderiales bacterium]|nr:MAG: DNA gyrase inhibitor YacG [Burkholderiales bacterium]